MRRIAVLSALLLLGAVSAAQAHVASNSFLSVRVDGARVAGALELAVRDAEIAVGVDSNHDGKITWGEVRSAQAALLQYLHGHLQLAGADGRCALRFGALQINERIDGNYLWLPFTANCRQRPRAPDHRLPSARCRGSFASWTADLERSGGGTDRRAGRRRAGSGTEL